MGDDWEILGWLYMAGWLDVIDARCPEKNTCQNLTVCDAGPYFLKGSCIYIYTVHAISKSCEWMAHHHRNHAWSHYVAFGFNLSTSSFEL